MNDDKNQTKEHLTERFKQLFEGMSSGVAVYEAVDGGNDFIFKDFNRAAEKIEQVRREEIIGRRVTEVFPGVEEFGLLEVLRQVWKTGSARNHPITFYKDQKITGWRENYIYKLPSGEVVALYDDITERKRAEERIKHINLVLRAGHNVNQLITQEKDPARLLQGSCEILTSTRGDLNAWIALLDESGKLLRSAESEVGEDFAAVIKRLERGELTECAKKALSSSKVQMIGEPSADCRDCPLADTSSGRSALVKRLEYEGKVYGILAASIPRELASDEEGQDIFSEVADDIAFALHNFEVEEERKQAEEELKAANQQLTASDQQLRAANQQLRAIEKELRTVNLALRERVKELNYFYQLSTLNEKPNITLEEILQGVVELIPSSYQYPKITCGRIILGDQEFKTENFRETSWKQTANLIARGKRTGTMEVCYLEERPERDEGPFLEEERKLIDAIAERSGKIIERKQAEKKLRESENFLRSVFRAAPSGIGVVTDRVLKQVNRHFCEITGYSSAEIIGRNAHFLYPTEEEYEHVESEKYAQIRDHGTGTVETRFKHRDGHIIDVLLSSSPLDPADLSKGFIFTALDITWRKQAEEELIKLQKLESIGVLAGGIAHDFNNILTTILGNISFIRTALSPESDEYDALGDAEEGCREGKNLTQQLLTFARGGKPVKKTINISEVLKEAVSFVLSGSNVRCRFEIADDLRPIDADSGQIHQAISNLIINADHAMPEGGTITIKVDNVTFGEKDVLPLAEGEYLRISISDTGIGIKKENLSLIFDPYFTTSSTGSGLGLARVYSIVTRHGGYVTVESEPGTGTSFYIYLPASSKEIKSRKETREDVVKGSGRILLMDDDEMIRNVARRLIEWIGYEIDTAVDGREAIEKYRAAKKAGTPFDVVILDLTIPGGMGGIKAFAQLKEIDPGVKAIVSSGYSSDSVMADYAKLGFAGMIPKPYKMDALSRILAKVTENTDLHR